MTQLQSNRHPNRHRLDVFLVALLILVGCRPSGGTLPSATVVQLVAASFVDADRGWVAARACDATNGSSSGACLVQIFRTEDGGATWARAAQFLLTPRALSFADRQTGWLVGSIGNACGSQACPNAVMLSQDGGLTWNRVSTVSVDLQSVSATSPSDAWAVGRLCGSNPDCGAVVVATASAGQTWQNQSLAIAGQGFQLLRPSTEMAVVSGMASDGAVLAQTNNRGATWQTERPPCQGSGDSLTFHGPKEGWLACMAPPGGPVDRLDVLRTGDGGQTWAKVSSVTFRGDPLPSRTPDHGPASPRTAALTFVTPTQGWLVDSRGEVFSTSDGGASWTDRLDVDEPLQNVQFVNAQHGWVLGARSVWRTGDGGQTWIRSDVVGGKWPVLPSPPRNPEVE